MPYLTKYNPLIAWRTIARDVFQLTRATVDNPATYQMTIAEIDSNDLGHGETAVNWTFTDYFGNPYKIINTGESIITVEDVFRVGCPTSGKQGWIHKSAYKGYSQSLPANLFWNLHPLASSNNNKYAMSILWGNDSNSIRVPFTTSDSPAIETYKDDQEINGVVVNLYEDYGDNPDCILFEQKIDEETGDVIELKRTELQVNVMVDDIISRIYFGTFEPEITGFILIGRK